MLTKLLIAALTLAAHLPAQDAYARVLYFANRPGADLAGRRAFLDKVDQGRAAAVAAGESGGYLRLTLVHPSQTEAGHARLAVHFSTAGPTFETTHTKSFFAATGWNEETYTAQSMTYNQPAVKTEMWRRRVNLGSIAKGDFIRMAFIKFKPGARGHYLEAIPKNRAVMEQVLKSGGPIKAYWLITTLFPGEDAPYDAIALFAYATEADVFKEFPVQEKMFQQAFPGANFQAHLDANRRNSAVRSQEVLRVSSAFWR